MGEIRPAEPAPEEPASDKPSMSAKEGSPSSIGRLPGLSRGGTSSDPPKPSDRSWPLLSLRSSHQRSSKEKITREQLQSVDEQPAVPPLGSKGDLFNTLLPKEKERRASSSLFVRHADGTYNSLEPLELPMRRTLSYLRWIAGIKTMILFLVFYGVYISLSVVRLDWWQGHETLTFLKESHRFLGIKPIEELHSVKSIASYLEHDLGTVIAELHTHHECATCQVGITPMKRDMKFLSLTDFVCSDFDSNVGTDHYPPRDCEVEDKEWAADPTSTSAPCCRDSRLVTASLSMMTEHIKYGITSMPLKQLLNGGTDPSYSSSEYFLVHHIKQERFMLQLVISRGQRMAAVEYHASRFTEDAPERVVPIETFWSFNYASPLPGVLAWLLLVAGCYVVAHDLRDHWDQIRLEHEKRARDNPLAPANHDDGIRQTLTRVSAATSAVFDSVSTVVSQTAHRPVVVQPFVLFVAVPSIVAPMLLEVVRPYMLLSQWTFLVTCTEMVLTVRLMHEGKIVPALKLIVNVIEGATPHLAALIVVLGPTTLLTVLMHGQLFGLFDDGFADPFIALTRVVRTLTAPPPEEFSEGLDGTASPVGSELMYYWNTLVFRLCFGSFVVAILVGAFNRVIVRLEGEQEVHKRNMSLPPEYTPRTLAFTTRAADFLMYVLAFPMFTTLYGMPVPRLISVFEEKIHHVEVADSSDEKENPDHAKHRQLMLHPSELEEIIGTQAAGVTAGLLLDRHGVRKMSTDEMMAV